MNLVKGIIIGAGFIIAFLAVWKFIVLVLG